ncbi:hypothetical protein T484DRAFT_1834512 [Baffinella frigidus]|nr:hypothetical protein T484DRAFT_1834512 [Cryptophyta sp. CCMP2293]
MGAADGMAGLLLDAGRWLRAGERERAVEGRVRARAGQRGIASVALFVVVLGAAVGRAAGNSIVPDGNAVVQARMGCPITLQVNAAGDYLNRTQIWGAFDEQMGLPPGATMACRGAFSSVGGGLQVCLGGPISLSFSADAMHQGKTFHSRVLWRGGTGGVEGAVSASAASNITIEVSAPSVAFLGEQGDNPADVQNHLTFNVGCPGSFMLAAADSSAPATVSALNCTTVHFVSCY